VSDPDTSPETLEALSRYFLGGEADLEVVQAHASGDMVVLVAIERQHGEAPSLDGHIFRHSSLTSPSRR
jgi:hypothetical protein